MRVLSVPSAAALAAAAANWTAIRCATKPRAVFALPTGSTPLGLYAELIARSRAGDLDMSAAQVFNLDEFRGVSAGDTHSYAAFLRRHLLDALALPESRVRLLRGDAPDAAAECAAYDAAIAACGGLDAAILGLGANGHVAFNEPGTPWDLTTHVAELAESTRDAQARDVRARDAGDAWEVPRQGLTMGLGTLRAARHVLLMIAGDTKRAARAALHRGIATRDWPVTALLDHPHLTVLEIS